MKRLLLIIMILVMTVGMVAGCTSTETAEQTSAPKETEATEVKTEETAEVEETEVITLRFMTRLGEDVAIADSAILDKVKEFDEMHPEIEIINESIPGADDRMFFDKVKSYISVGDYPDIIHNYGGASILSYVENGLIVDLEPYFEEDPEWRESMLDMHDLWQFSGIEGTYGIPLRYFGVNLYYNKDLFEQYGLEAPTTIEELEEVSKVFIDNGIVPMAMGGANGWRSAHLSTVIAMKLYGPELIDDLANRTKKYTDEEMVTVFSKLNEWNKTGVFGPSASGIDYDMELMMFKTGQTAMHYDGTWAAEGIAEATESEGFEFGYVNFPYFEDVPERQYYTMGGADGAFCIMDNDDKAREEAAVALLKYILNVESVEYNYTEGGTQLMPFKTEIMPFPDTAFYSEIAEVIGQDGVTYRTEIDVYDSLPQLMDAFRNATQGIIAGQSVEEACQLIQDEIDNSSN